MIWNSFNFWTHVSCANSSSLDNLFLEGADRLALTTPAVAMLALHENFAWEALTEKAEEVLAFVLTFCLWVEMSIDKWLGDTPCYFCETLYFCDGLIWKSVQEEGEQHFG